jgi:hypothetical protein
MRVVASGGVVSAADVRRMQNEVRSMVVLVVVVVVVVVVMVVPRAEC